MSDEGVKRAVAVGGGTGLPKVLAALRGSGYDVTAVVTMADDGGSSGALRREIGILPPGDVRNCLVALAEGDGLHARVFQYRFPHGEGIGGHALGNLIIAALTDITGSFIDAVRVSAEWLGTRGTVLPSTLEDVSLSAVDRDGNLVAGQAAVANSAVPIVEVRLDPPAPSPYPPVLDAVAEADLVVVGPGSLFTSIIPNFLVDGVAEALRESRARRVYLCNVANQRGETGGMDAFGHVEALFSHGLAGAFDVVAVHDEAGHPVDMPAPVSAGPAVLERIRGTGLEVVAADLVDPEDTRHHAVEGLARLLEEVG